MTDLSEHYAKHGTDEGQILLKAHHLNLTRSMGEQDGIARASAMRPADAPGILEAIAAGDVPYPLSGEWAGDMTPNRLCAEILGEHWDGWPGEDHDVLCDEYEDGFQVAYHETIASLIP